MLMVVLAASWASVMHRLGIQRDSVTGRVVVLFNVGCGGGVMK